MKYYLFYIATIQIEIISASLQVKCQSTIRFIIYFLSLSRMHFIIYLTIIIMWSKWKVFKNRLKFIFHKS